MSTPPGQSEKVIERSSQTDLLDMLPAAIYTTDIEGHLTFYNQAAVNLLGLEPELGTDLWSGSCQLFRPDETPLPLDECPLAIAIKEGRDIDGAAIVIRRPDGTRRGALAYSRLLRDDSGRVTGALNTLIDTSEHSSREESEHRLAAIIESSEDAIISKDLNGIIKSWNDGATRLFGYSAEEAVGRPIAMLFPKDRLSEEDNILARIQRGERVHHYDTIRLRKDGTPRDISLTVSPVRSRDGTIVGASKIARDITQRKESEKRILMLMREVNHRVKNQYAVILAMIRESGKKAQDARDFEQRICARVMGLSRSHDMLVHADWRGAELSDLLLEQAVPILGENQLDIDGPSILLQPAAAQYLGMAFHELATNAVLHGAFAYPGGRTRVAWSISRQDDNTETFHLTWTETGKQADLKSLEPGFGSLVLRKIAPDALSGRAWIDHSPTGLTWSLKAPLTYLLADR